MHSPGSVAFSVFGLDVMWYGLLIGGGFLLATLISYRRAPRHDQFVRAGQARALRHAQTEHAEDV